MARTRRILRYHRAGKRLNDRDNLEPINLQELLEPYLQQIQLPHEVEYNETDVSLKALPLPQGFEFRNGIALHLVKYAGGTHDVVVNHQRANLGTQAPRAGEDFVRGAVFVLIREHHVVSLAVSPLRETACLHYARELAGSFNNTGLTAEQRQDLKTVRLWKPTQRGALQRIAEQGVKELILHHQVPASFAAEQQRRGLTLWQAISNWLGLSPDEQARYAQDALLKVRASAKPASRRGEQREEAMESEAQMAQRILEGAEDEGFTIVLRDDTKITRHEMEYRKAVTLEEPHPGFIDPLRAFQELQRYYEELRTEGAFD